MLAGRLRKLRLEELGGCGLACWRLPMGWKSSSSSSSSWLSRGGHSSSGAAGFWGVPSTLESALVGADGLPLLLFDGRFAHIADTSMSSR